MNITIVLAQVLGIFFAIVGISMVVNKKTIVAAVEEITRNPGVLWFWGLIALIIGAVFIVLNNTWTSGWVPLLITVIGWLALIKGVFILLFSRTAAAFYKKCVQENMLTYAGCVVFILGLILLYQGFMYY